MRTFSFTVTGDEAGERLDRFLAQRLANRYSRSFIKKLIDNGFVQINGVAPKPHHKIREGELVELREHEFLTTGILPENITVDIVYEDEALIVVNKPAGMVVHPGAGNFSGTLVNALLHYCKELSAVGEAERPGIVHRIDKGTSGLIVVAKHNIAHRNLARQFKQRKVKKIYVALVKGVVQLDHGTIDTPIARSHRDRKKMGVQFAESKTAITRYSVVRRFKDSTFVELRLETGRTHQIRVHMAYSGHPILGDDKYGGRCREIDRPALHAKALGFKHPVSKKFVEFESPLPDDIRKVLEGYEEEKD